MSRPVVIVAPADAKSAPTVPAQSRDSRNLPGLDGPPRSNRDENNHDYRCEADERIGDRKAQLYQQGARDHGEAHDRIDQGVIAIRDQSGIPDGATRPRPDLRGYPVAYCSDYTARGQHQQAIWRASNCEAPYRLDSGDGGTHDDCAENQQF